MGGIKFFSIKENTNTPSSSSSSLVGGLIGVFGGISIERNFDNSQFSLVGEVQYNLSREDIVSVVGDYSGQNINIGGRFYFSDRREQ
ncbi:MAG: hypothetical protein WCA84_18570 [Ignavibacteriaceae bacterium]|jgi:hypothetical protein